MDSGPNPFTYFGSKNPKLTVEARAEIGAWTAEFSSHRIDHRPAFVLRSVIGDTAILSGLYRPEPLIAAINAMIADEDAYKRFAATHDPMPPKTPCATDDPKG